MSRCVQAALVIGAAVAGISPAMAQVQRNFPATALRGELVVLQPPEVLLNGKPARLAPGARIRDMGNVLVMSGALQKLKLPVNYTLEHHGMLLDIWVLRDDERARQPWPRTPAEAQAWAFDPAAQSWTKP
ncbi:MAG: hypothetical protein JNN18_05300 [Rubrivivax sp.]|nr:hypothetical protein [Rubrivivax sp.]